MKKILFIVLGMMVGYSTVSALSFFDNTSTVYTKDEQKAVSTSDICKEDPLRCGMNNPGKSINGIYYQGEITSTNQAQNQTLSYARNIMNWVLGLLGVVALLYLLYHGFMIVTAAGDEAATKKGWKGLRTATIAIMGIGLSWGIVSLIIYLINLFTS